jgi:hypothetical protein
MFYSITAHRELGFRTGTTRPIQGCPSPFWTAAALVRCLKDNLETFAVVPILCFLTPLILYVLATRGYHQVFFNRNERPRRTRTFKGVSTADLANDPKKPSKSPSKYGIRPALRKSLSVNSDLLCQEGLSVRGRFND